MKLSDLNSLSWSAEEAREHVETDGSRIVDGRLLFNQRDTAKLLGISSRAFSEWPIQPMKRQHREKIYYWPDVLRLQGERYKAGLYVPPRRRPSGADERSMMS